jgi:phytoene desaturase
MKRKVAIIGSGFSGLSAAAYLSKQGMQVTVFEKNSTPGGRAGRIEANGFVFDKGPSWYWSPDIYERFFEQFNKSPSDYYNLNRINPSCRIFFAKDDYIDIPSDIEELKILFESVEAGSSKKLTKFLLSAQFKYELGTRKLIYKPSLSGWEYMEPWLLAAIFKLDLFKSISSYIRTLFKNPRLIQILEFPITFFGSAPTRTPALFTLMNYAELVLGTWYPAGGMYSVVEGIYKLSLELGVNFIFNASVSKIEVYENEAKAVWVNNERVEFDIVLGTADYHHIEMDLLNKEFQSYSDKYWEQRELSPSALIFFIGINKKITNILHHNLFFDKNLAKHADQSFNNSSWSEEPSIYVSCISKTEISSAPIGCENLVVIIPIGPGIKDNEEIRTKYFDIFLNKFQSNTGENIKNNIIFLKSYASNDFVNEYNSYKGNAYGLSSTLRQTTFLKPSIRSKKVNNLFFAGQCTNPGPGVPFCIVSGQVAATEILKRI